jgi:hypothetical protein
VVVAHETVHSIYKSEEPGVLRKLDYKNAYDRVNIDFLMEILRLRGFGERWIGWIKQIVCGGFVSVGVNGGGDSSPFKIGKGLRQGGPSVPHSF